MYSVDINGKRITVVKGDITHQETEAIVNAANSTLLGGGGVDGAIHKAAGPKLLEECRKIKETLLRNSQGLLPAGQAVVTPGYNLAAQYVVHTVGPIYGHDDHPDELLRSAYRNSLRLAEDNGIHSIAFPSIGTGAYGCPIAWAAGIALTAIRDFLLRPTALEEVRMVLFSQNDYEVYSRVLTNLTE